MVSGGFSLEDLVFSGRLLPDWLKNAWAATAGLGSTGINFKMHTVTKQDHVFTVPRADMDPLWHSLLFMSHRDRTTLHK